MWLFAHIALSFVGIAAFATAAAAGAMYLCSGASSSRAASARSFASFRRSRRSIASTTSPRSPDGSGSRSASCSPSTYSVAYHELNLPQLVWGGGAWLAVTLHRARSRGARMAGAARGEVLERSRSSRCSCCTSRSASPAPAVGTVPVSAYPLMLEGAALSALVVGGGSVATRKAIALLAAGARVHVVAPASAPSSSTLADGDDRARRVDARAYSTVRISATRCSSSPRPTTPATNARDRGATRGAQGRLVNVVDAPDAGNCITPAVHRVGRRRRRGDAPAACPTAAARIRDALAVTLDERYAAAVARARARCARRCSTMASATGGPRRPTRSSATTSATQSNRDASTRRVAEWR